MRTRHYHLGNVDQIRVFVKPGLNPTTFSSVEMTEVLGEEGWEEHRNLPQVMMIVIKMLVLKLKIMMLTVMMMRRKMVMMV